MRAQRIVRHERLRNHVRSRLPHPGIDMRAVVAEWKSVETAVYERCHVVGHEITSDFIALVDDRPQLARGGNPGESVGIAQTRCIDPVLTGGGIDFPYRRPSCLGGESVLTHVTVRSH